jgi:hypothetical protein
MVLAASPAAEETRRKAQELQAHIRNKLNERKAAVTPPPAVTIPSLPLAATPDGTATGGTRNREKRTTGENPASMQRNEYAAEPQASPRATAASSFWLLGEMLSLMCDCALTLTGATRHLRSVAAPR